MPSKRPVPPRLRGKTFRGSRAVALGYLTENQLRGPAWRRLFRDVYVDAAVDVTHGLRAVAAARLLVPDAVVSGPSAAVLWGVDLAGPDDDVELTLPPGTHARRMPGLRVRRAHIGADEIHLLRATRVTGPALTAVRVATLLTPEAAVVALDRLVVAGVVDLDSVRARAALPGVGAHARRACQRADGLAQSPRETELRLLMQGAGLPTPLAQYVVEHEGRFVARVDFAWPELKVAVEYDGYWHSEDRQFAKDRRRLNRLREAGWTVVFVTAADMRDPRRLAAMIRAALVA